MDPFLAKNDSTIFETEWFTIISWKKNFDWNLLRRIETAWKHNSVSKNILMPFRAHVMHIRLHLEVTSVSLGRTSNPWIQHHLVHLSSSPGILLLFILSIRVTVFISLCRQAIICVLHWSLKVFPSIWISSWQEPIKWLLCKIFVNKVL